MYDAAIIGGGPAGLMAAKTASEGGLKTVLLEKRPSVGTITRACCQQFIMDEGYEGETISLQPGKIVFQKNGFEVPYTGPLFGVREKRYISPGGHTITFSHADGRPLAVQFDKGQLQQTLWNCCAEAGVELIPGATVFNARDEDGKVTIDYIHSGSARCITAAKIICADGVNSRSASALGLNTRRKYILTSRAICYVLENVFDETPFVMKSFIGNVYESQGPIILYPYFDDPKRARLFVAGTKSKLPDAVLANARTKGCLKAYLEHAQVVQKTGCGLRVHTPLSEPCSGNSLVIGDAAAYVEVETQGALMCGYKSALAVRDELDGKDGFARYNNWWHSSFEFNGPDVAMVAQGYVLVPVYTDEELDYLFSLTSGETLPGSYSQYRTPKYMWDAILKHTDRIAREHPVLLKKISNNMHLSLKNVLLI
jgi:flavin-dependent dehydrogenase